MKANSTIEEINVDDTVTLVDEKRTPLFLKRVQEEKRLIWHNPLDRPRFKSVPDVQIEDVVV